MMTHHKDHKIQLGFHDDPRDPSSAEIYCFTCDKMLKSGKTDREMIDLILFAKSNNGINIPKNVQPVCDIILRRTMKK